MALIIDDRDDVWEGPQGMHLLLVRPYTYFKSAPEVNNVSGQKTLQQAASHENEQRADEPAVEESDGYLLHVARMLKSVHREYYNRFSQLQSVPSPLPDVRADAALILQQHYQKALQDVKVAFSALIPTSDRDPSRHQLWRYAEKLGATVVGSIAEATHLVAAKYVELSLSAISLTARLFAQQAAFARLCAAPARKPRRRGKRLQQETYSSCTQTGCCIACGACRGWTSAGSCLQTLPRIRRCRSAPTACL
jgi:hypothetical protein